MNNTPKYVEYAHAILKNMDQSEVDENYNILQAAASTIEKTIDIRVENTHLDILVTMFDITFKTIVKRIKMKVNEGKSHYRVIVAKRVEIGYDNALDEDYEDNGGFMFYMKHLYLKQEENIKREYGDSVIELCAMWNSMNVSSDMQFIADVISEAKSELNKQDIALETDICIIPIFAIIYDQLVDEVSKKRKELGEFEYVLSFLSSFDVKAVQSDNMDDVIIFTPSIEYKLELKDNHTASARYE